MSNLLFFQYVKANSDTDYMDSMLFTISIPISKLEAIFSGLIPAL